MEILLDEVAEKHNLELNELKDFLIVNSDIFHFTQDSLSEEIYVYKFDSDDLAFLYKETVKKNVAHNPTAILEEYLESFFVNTEKMIDYL